MLVHAMGWLLSGLALCGAGYALASAWFVGRFGDDAPATDSAAPVTLLKPLHWDEPGLKDNLATFFVQDYAGPVQVVFGVQDAADPAIAVVRDLQAAYPKADIDLVIDTDLHGTNRKISNLINMAPRIKHDIVVMSDSDIAVSRDWLRRIVGGLEQPGTGAVTCLYSGKARGNIWSTLSAMGASYEFLPNVVAGTSWKLAWPCLGSTIALKRATLDAIGGFRAFANFLADDYEMGRAIRARGLKIAVPGFAVEHTSPETRWSDYFRHELRWNRTTRVIDWLGHTGSVVTHAVPLAILGLVLSGFTVPGAAILAVAIASRLWLKWRIERKFAISAGPGWALPLRDVISFVVYLASYFGEDVHWRGDRFQVSPSGALSQL
jgi:ceramide glucosyltransferase